MIKSESKPYSRPNCPKCGSKKIWSLGKRWQCGDCKHSFHKTEEDKANFQHLPNFRLFRGNQYVKSNREPKHKAKIKLEKEFESKPNPIPLDVLKRMVSIEHLSDVPCFLCPNLDKNCDVSACEKLGAWLLNASK